MGHLKLNQPAAALLHASAAMQIAPRSPPAKACFHAAKAAHALGHATAARYASQLIPASERTGAVTRLVSQVSQEADADAADAASFGRAVLLVAAQAQEAAPSAIRHEGRVSAAELKTQGTAAFRAGDTSRALQHWRNALLAMPVAAVLFRNLAAAHLVTRASAGATSAAACAAAALAWDARDAKALRRGAQAA